jgi:hypothetical protein
MIENLIVGTRIDHDKYGEGIISRVTLTNFEVFFVRGGKIEFSRSNTDFEIIESPEHAASESKEHVNIDQLEKIVSYVLDKYGSLQEIVPLGDKWTGGKLVMQPGISTLQSKEIPIEAFFHKIVMLRDRLRVLEQNINSNEKLTDEDKINLQQYITRIYGSLTTFNVLFSEKEHYFVGAGGKTEK